jgi:hypothetical protein
MRLPTMTMRRLMAAVAVVAVALSVEGAVRVTALLVLIRAVRRPHPVHLTNDYPPHSAYRNPALGESAAYRMARRIWRGD